VGEHQGPNAAARRGLRGLGHRGVVVDRVHEALHRDHPNEIVTQDCLDVQIRALAQFVKPSTRQRVAGEDDRLAADLYPVAERRLDGAMIGPRGDNPHAAFVECDTRFELHDIELRLRSEILVMREAVLNIWAKHRN
jgi:hypothetical protein